MSQRSFTDKSAFLFPSNLEKELNLEPELMFYFNLALSELLFKK